MIIGAHAILYSTDADADRAFLRDVLWLPHVDVGEGWLVFGLPPAEVAVHPAKENGVHELYLMCEDVEAFVEELAGRGAECGPIEDRGWGLLTEVTLPGGSKLGVYEPRHARPAGTAEPSPKRRAPAKPARRAKPKAGAKAKVRAKAAPPRSAGRAKKAAPRKPPRKAAGKTKARR